MVYRNVSYLILGIVFGALLGSVLGILVCDETKRAIMKAIQKRAKMFSQNCKSTSERAMDAVDNDAVKSSIRDLL